MDVLQRTEDTCVVFLIIVDLGATSTAHDLIDQIFLRV